MKGISHYLIFTILFIFLLPSPHSSAQDTIESKLHLYIEKYIEEQRIPGAAVSIVENDNVLYSESFGKTGGKEIEITPDTPFLLGSISKSLTALAVLKLAEEGVIGLEDPIQIYLPSFTLQDKEAASKITIKQLLTQASGFSTYEGMTISDLGSNERDAIQTNIQILSDTKLTETPGTKHQYSNANYSILAGLIEEVSGQSYADFMDERVFKPLGMTHAAADMERATDRGYQSGYQSWFGFPVKSEVPYDNGGAPYGYITASSNDMIHYIKALIDGNTEKLVNEELLNLAFSPHVQTGETRYYGFGWRITAPGSDNEMIWHSGSTPDSRTDIFFYPKSKWGAVILTNKEHILEESALIHFRNGIISIMNGEEPMDVDAYKPTVQIAITLLLLILAGNIIRILLKNKSSKVIRYRRMNIVLGIIMVFLAILLIPLLIYFSSSPWHSITLFAPDIALLTVFLTVFLFVNGILLLFSRKGKKTV
ncbi:serine hydrolase domain-containing protein [Fredinandcohnia sp. QZ13]|uniref:serine hydrolase domain-containing protein n=1 Tax=Fredinandcohnia sp. QZ13 TaxID=3073144 RepID=UPI00285334F7|nr:serine hydrolase domain-containing protein [Fredinandcohnia sp. QZ13]MDR4889801.1 serine hydrolase domain-containing protein [Fredinandcohnia sp. QZ13]